MQQHWEVQNQMHFYLASANTIGLLVHGTSLGTWLLVCGHVLLQRLLSSTFNFWNVSCYILAIVYLCLVAIFTQRLGFAVSGAVIWWWAVALCTFQMRLSPLCFCPCEFTRPCHWKISCVNSLILFLFFTLFAIQVIVTLPYDFPTFYVFFRRLALCKLPKPYYHNICCCCQFYLSLCDATGLGPGIASAISPLTRPVSTGTQTFSDDPSTFPVSKEIPKLSAKLQVSCRLHAQQHLLSRPCCRASRLNDRIPYLMRWYFYFKASGEAQYISDRKIASDELHCALVVSDVANADIDEIYDSMAVLMPGFVQIIKGL